jgi:hypothetical protein
MVDLFYFSHSDWPVGRGFAVGHVMLTSLFVFLATANLALAVCHTWLKA